MFISITKKTLISAILAGGALHLAGCSEPVSNTQTKAAPPADIPLFAANLVTNQQPKTRLSISIPEQSKALTGAFTEVDNQTLSAEIAPIAQTTENALTLRINDTWRGSLQLTSEQALDLTPYMQSGSLDLHINVDDFQKTALDLVMDCGEGCESSVRLREWAQQAENSGWQNLSIPLACFNKDEASFDQVKTPVTLQMGGKGQISIASIDITATGTTNFSCADKAELSTTPDILNEYWALDWWMPRHNEKVAIAQQGNIDLLMIGDSITHGWESHGKDVWLQHFSDIPTLNIGFGGDRTENVIWRLQHNTVDGISPKLAVMMIGTNNTGHRHEKPEYIAKGVKAIIEELQTRLPNTPLLLLAIFPRSANPEDSLRINNEQTNVLLEALAKQYEHVQFANFNQAFLQADGTLTTEIMPDLLHPHAEGYEIWAQQLKPFINQYVRQK